MRHYRMCSLIIGGVPLLENIRGIIAIMCSLIIEVVPLLENIRGIIECVHILW